MHFYAMSYREALDLPIRTFWYLNSCINGIQAQKDMRSLTVAVCSQQGEQAPRELRQRLVIEAGEPVKLKFDPMRDAVRDEIGFKALREMANQA